MDRMGDDKIPAYTGHTISASLEKDLAIGKADCVILIPIPRMVMKFILLSDNIVTFIVVFEHFLTNHNARITSSFTIGQNMMTDN